AAVLGGIGSLPGAMLGGLLLGVLEALFAGVVSSDYKDVFAFSILVLVLIFKPSGLLGRPAVEKVYAMHTQTQSPALSTVTKNQLDLGHAFKDAFTAGVLALVVFSPISNFVLDQYSFKFLPWRLPVVLNGIYLALLVFIGRFSISVMLQLPGGRR